LRRRIIGILNDLGVADSVPVVGKIDIGGFFSNTWIYILVVVIVGIILLITITFVLFFRMYNKKIILFENISGQGYQPVLKTRARTVRLGIGGEEILKTFSGGKFITAYGKKMGKNTFWFAKGQDGYWYNIVIGDLDSKRAMLDIDPIDRDVRMFHVALDRLSHQTYGKNSFMEKYGTMVISFIFLLVLVLGMWFIVGKIGDAVAPLAMATEKSLEIQETNSQITSKLVDITKKLGMESEASPGLVPAG
jgi:hypothetical protein